MSNFFNNEQEPLTLENADTKRFYGSKYLGGKGEKTKKFLIITISLIISAIAIVYFFLQLTQLSKSNDALVKNGDNAQNAMAVSYLDINPIVVGLLPSSNDRQNYLKLHLTLQLSSDVDNKIVQNKLPIIVDNLQMFLKELRAIDLEGSGSSLYLKEELIKRVNKVISPVVANDVLIKEMILN